MAKRLSKPPKYQQITPVGPSREPIKPIGDNQTRYLKALRNKNITQVFAVGPAGTGKTWLAATIAADMLEDGGCSKIICVRPVVGCDGEDLGYYPGDQKEKYGHWVIPLLDAFEARLGKDRVRRYIAAGKIEFAPLSTMRGRTLADAFILLDEAQNTTLKQMEMFLTRPGQNAKVVVTGDLGQTDVPNKNGLKTALHIIDALRLRIPVCLFGASDVVRSEDTKMWVDAFELYKSGDY